MTKEAKKYFRDYNYSMSYELCNVYDSWSYEKEQAFNNFKNAYNELVYDSDYNNYGGMKIISYNSNFFTLAFTYYNYFIVITYANIYVYDLTK